ncbi:MAG TPA: 4-oxalocrotonate tautomerase [Burkholderiales bacterium]
MPLIRVEMFPGRSMEQKREFAQAVTREASRILQCDAEAVDILFAEIQKEDWATGGKFWSDRK